MKYSTVVCLLIAAGVSLSGCAASSKTFYADSGKIKDTTLCRTFFEAQDKGDYQFANDTWKEMGTRGLTVEACKQRVGTENGVLVASALIAAGVGIGIACRNGCSGGGYSGPNYATYQDTDVDCTGGRGNGPRYISGPIAVGVQDPYRLDADHDGIGCEASDLAWGA